MSGCENSDTLECCPHHVHVKLRCKECEFDERFDNLQYQVNHSYEGIEKLFDRLEKLEENFNPIWKKIYKLEREIQNMGTAISIKHNEQFNTENRKQEFDSTITETLKKLDDFRKKQIDENRAVCRAIESVEEDIKEINIILDEHRRLIDGSHKVPYKCPVCDGCGNSKGTIETHGNFEFHCKYASCHSCEGKGIIWD